MMQRIEFSVSGPRSATRVEQFIEAATSIGFTDVVVVDAGPGSVTVTAIAARSYAVGFAAELTEKGTASLKCGYDFAISA